MRNLICLILGSLILLISCAGSRQKTYDEYYASSNSAPIQIKSVQPVYPYYAQTNGITGTIWLKIRIDTLGVVSEPTILPDSSYNIEVFKDAAIQAAMQTKWKPARENGKPIETWVTYRVDFNLKQK